MLNFLLQREVWTCDATVRAAPQSQLVFELYVIGGSGHRVEGNLIASAVRGGVRSSCEVPSEVLVLRWAQVDFGAGSVRLEPGTTKTGEGRVFPFTADLRALLARRRVDARDGDGLVFTRASGEPIRSFNKAWASACRAGGVPGRVLHDFRRTAVRNLLRAGVPERVAMQMVGWKSRQMLDRYHIVNTADLLDAARRLDAARAAADRA